MAVNITPLHDRVLVRRLEEKETVKGGIIIPDTAKEKPQEGEVVAVGAGKINDKGERIALDVKVGDRVLFGKYSGNDIKVDDEEYMILKEDEILAKIGGAAKAAKKYLPCSGANAARPRKATQVNILTTNRKRRHTKCQSRSLPVRIRARRFSAASTSWPTL